MKTMTCLTWTLLISATAMAADGEWISLTDGKSFAGWKANENPETWTLEDGAFVCHGKRSHLFYVGPHAPFKDFELELEILTYPNSNAGVYFHTKYQESGWPAAGFEAQVNNTYNSDPRKTGSLYAVKDVLKQIVKDNEWWTYNIRVEGKKVTIKVNGKTVNEYIEPEGKKPEPQGGRVLSQGTFALQGHDPGSTVKFRKIRVKKLGNRSKTSGVRVGDPAPSFTLKDDQGRDWNSNEHFAQGITVVYFYPADMTGGCTKQACAYRDDLASLAKQGIEVVGISGDSVENHQHFKRAHQLNFTLLADPQAEAARKFGVPHKLGTQSIVRQIDGKDVTLVRTATIQRWTFLIKDGKVVYINSKVAAPKDSQTIQNVIKNLK